MRLAHIKLAGFKSFVDPAVIPVPGDLVGIVGPNGCGKSNVIDAVRWVLGESKASALRGESMQDVIFSGSANRKAVSRASVELIFDNKSGKASGQWSSFAEISIKRIVHRDGDSVYYINNLRVRRRDIADLFLGTGVGGRGYAIIEQGMISRIIEAKPKELKVFLEEAAGVSKYRARRHETELRLNDTEKNLLRVEDICQELRKQLQHLGAQAEVAKQFHAIQDKLTATRNLLWLVCKHEAVTQRVNAEKEIQQLEIELEAETAFLRKTEKEVEDIRSRHYATSDALHQEQGKLYAADAEITTVEQAIKHLRENEQRIALQVTDIEGQLVENREQKRSAVDNLTHWQSETEQASLSHETCRENHSSANESLPNLEYDFREKQEKFNSCQRDLLLIEQAQQQEESHHVHAVRIIQQLAARQQRLKQEVEALPQVDHVALSQLQQELDDLNNNYHQKDSALEQTASQLSLASEYKDQVAEKLQLVRQNVTQKKARFDALQRLQMQLESNQALNTWLAKHQFEDMSRLWQSIQIEEGWEDALEAVLRERLNGAGFEQLEIIQQWTDDLPPGKWTLFQIADEQSSKLVPHQHVNLKPIQAHLTCADLKIEAVLNEWLSNVYVVKDLQTGLLERKKLSLGETLVTPEGHIFTFHSLTFFSPDSQLHGVLMRQQELKQLEVEIKTLEADLEEEKIKLVVAEQTYEELNETIISLRHDIKLLKQQYHDMQLQMMKRSQSAEQTDKRRNQIEEDLIEISHQFELETLHKKEAQSKMADYAQQIVVIKDQLQELKREWQSAEALLVEQRQLVQAAMEKLQEAIFHENTCQHKIGDIEKTIQVISENTQRLEENLGSLLVEQSNIDETKLNNQLQDCLSQRIKHEHAISDVRNTLEAVTNELQTLEKARLVSEQKLHPLREAVNKSRLKEQEARIIEDRYSEQLAEVEADESKLLSLLSAARKKTLQADIERLTLEIEAMGAVNLAALDELQALQIRETYLESQLNDLKDAVSTLENVIRQIDDETQERLLVTFNAVNDNLERVFPAIFGGGHAKLLLSSDEILDSGILLTAQPPGKKNSSIHLLSGGEKALTALALVFSLFQLNPAPFCLLDEVDAPLDDSNTGRFCELVKKMSKETQFMFISHNKITMELAQQLIGVTMQEQGVSRIVAVDIDEAIRLNEAVVA